MNRESQDTQTEQTEDDLNKNENKSCKSSCSNLDKMVSKSDPGHASSMIGLGVNSTSSPNNQDIAINVSKFQKELSIEKNAIETYNLTHDNSNGYTLKFDDKNWSKNITSLKPLVILKFI